MKVVINGCFGGFGLSPKAYRRLAEIRGGECHFYKWKRGGALSETVPVVEPGAGDMFWYARDQHGKDIDDMRDDRANKELVALVEELGDEASGPCAELQIVEIPDGVDWEISEYDGNETVREKHRSWS